MKKRIVWAMGPGRALAYFPGEEATPVKFAWAKRRVGLDYVAGKEVEEEEPWLLLWDGLSLDTFKSEIEVKTSIIRLVYGIEQQYLIPSELLADARLKYRTEDWVDEWYCTDKNDEIIECLNVVRPGHRKIRLGESPRRQNDGYAAAQRQRAAYSQGRQGRVYEIPARVTVTPEPADEECYYVFKAGGHYDPEAKKDAGEEENAQKGDLQAQVQAAEAQEAEA